MEAWDARLGREVQANFTYRPHIEQTRPREIFAAANASYLTQTIERDDCRLAENSNQPSLLARSPIVGSHISFLGYGSIIYYNKKK